MRSDRAAPVSSIPSTAVSLTKPGRSRPCCHPRQNNLMLMSLTLSSTYPSRPVCRWKSLRIPASLQRSDLVGFLTSSSCITSPTRPCGPFLSSSRRACSPARTSPTWPSLSLSLCTRFLPFQRCTLLTCVLPRDPSTRFRRRGITTSPLTRLGPRAPRRGSRRRPGGRSSSPAEC